MALTTTHATNPVPTSPGADQRSGPVREAGPLREGLLFAVVILGRCYRAMLGTLVAVAIVPMLWSWTSYVVRSGSMEPAISMGDVVVARPFADKQAVPVGRVMLYETPNAVGGTTIRLHRVVEALDDGTYATAGDANAANDAAPVAREDFRAQALILVPYVGLPTTWLAEKDLVPLTAWLVATVLLLHLSFKRVDGDPPLRPGRRHLRRHLRRHTAERRQRIPAPRTSFFVGAAIAVLALTTTSATAVFTAAARNPGNSWQAGSLVQPYTTAVMADAPHAFYRLDETAGSNATDASGGGRTGTYTAVATYHQAGALPNNPGYSIALNRAYGRMVGGGPALADPTTFSVEVWFKTTTSAGGKIIGFENSRNQTSTLFDREAFMRTDGRIVYLGATSTTKLLVSPTALNNGAWHHLVITAVPSGSNEVTVMYVDGVPVASGNTAKAAFAYNGWWRVGYGRVPSGTLYPSTGHFTGSLDDVAIYRTQLSAARVSAHYDAR